MEHGGRSVKPVLGRYRTTVGTIKGMGVPRHRDLAPVVAQARLVLKELDRHEIPNGLERIAAQTGPRLPRPFENRLVQEIDTDEWFRGRVAESFEGEVDADDPTERAGALFLFRPDGWERRLEEIALRAESAELRERAESMERRIDDLESELGSWKDEAKQLRRKLSREAVQCGRRVAEARDQVRNRLDRRIGSLSRDKRRLEERLDKVTGERDEAREYLEFVKGHLEKVRRADRAGTGPAPGINAWADLDPLQAARLLDDVSRALAPDASFTDPELLPGTPTPLQLPDGIPPDARAVIEWLLTIDRSFVMLVDGYNVGFHLDRERFNTPEIRHRLQNDLVRLKGQAQGRPQVKVVYDSTQTGDLTSESVPGGIEVSFTNAGHIADDEIIRLAAVHGNSAVVVSSDRRVREQAEESGSLGVWSEALAAWCLNG